MVSRLATANFVLRQAHVQPVKIIQFSEMTWDQDPAYVRHYCEDVVGGASDTQEPDYSAILAFQQSGSEFTPQPARDTSVTREVPVVGVVQ